MEETPCIKIPFAIGKKIWWTGNGYRTENVVCPECAGYKYVTVIQGNGETYTLDCRCCQLGYDHPLGWIERTIHEHVPTPFIPGRVEISGQHIRYSESGPNATCYSSIDAENLFETEEECAVACEKENKKQAEWEAEREIKNLQGRRKDNAWSVHYWGGIVKRLERELEVTKARLDACGEHKKRGKAKEILEG
jgi:hypothetical protein